MKTKKNRVPNIIENRVAELLRTDRNLSAASLKRTIETQLKKEGKAYNFTERTYSTMKRKMIANAQIDNPLDEQWSIADCEKYNIPDDMIPIILERRKILGGAYGIINYPGPCDPHDDDGWIDIEEHPMTIRVARWMSRLKPSVDLLIEKFKNDGLDIDGRIDDASPEEKIRQKDSCLYWSLYNIAQVYAMLEGISEFRGYTRFDSSVADEYYFMKAYKNWGEFHDDIEMGDYELPRKLTEWVENNYRDKDK
jgi:hypothetical protein